MDERIMYLGGWEAVSGRTSALGRRVGNVAPASRRLSDRRLVASASSEWIYGPRIAPLDAGRDVHRTAGRMLALRFQSWGATRAILV